MISVIVPIYNVEEFLSSCIESIINQTYKNLEIILINDGSKDSSGKICDKYAQIDKRIKVIHKVNGGVSSARNAGLDVSKGEYISFIDPDDYINLNMYEKMYNIIKNSKCDIVSCDYRQINEQGDSKDFFCLTEDKIIFDKNNLVEQIFKYKNFDMVIFNKLYKASIFKDIRFPLNVNLGEDLRVLYPTIIKAKAVYCMKDVLYNKRVRKNSLTGNKNMEAYLSNVEEHELFLDNVKRDGILNYENAYNACSINLFRHYKRLLDRIYLSLDRKKYSVIEKDTREKLIELYKNKNLSNKYKKQIWLIKYNPYIYEKYRCLSIKWKKIKQKL